MQDPRLKDLLEKLVAIPSVNPAFGGEGEEALGRFVAGWLEEAGLRVEAQEVLPGRHNRIARVGDAKTPAVLLEAHLDTVGVAGWAAGSPFEPALREGRLYGRGACDTKASLAVFMAVARRFAARPPAVPIVFAATIDEEEKQSGAFRLLEKTGPLAGAITGEPTRLEIVHAHKGVLRFRIRTIGRAAHSAFPERGKNAIFAMAKVLERLERHAGELSESPPDPDLGRPSLNAGVIRGGQSVNVVPDSCEVEIDRRLLPSENGEAVFGEFGRLLGDPDDVEMEEPYLNRPGMATGRDHPFAAKLGAAVRAIEGDCVYSVAPYMTNAAAYAAAGVPALVFGPGDIAQAHTRDEFIEIDQLDAAYRILVRFLENEQE